MLYSPTHYIFHTLLCATCASIYNSSILVKHANLEILIITKNSLKHLSYYSIEIFHQVAV